MNERPIDVVLLHDSEDDQPAAELMGLLRGHGVEPWSLSTELHPGADSQTQLEDALNATSVCAVLLGQRARLPDPARKAVERRAARAPNLRVVGVLLPGTPQPTPSDTKHTADQPPDQPSPAEQAVRKDHAPEPGRDKDKEPM
jgi:TIR domain-containing protein